MDNKDKDIMADSQTRTEQSVSLGLQRLILKVIEGAEIGIQGLMVVAQDPDSTSGDRIDAMKSLITRIVPERVPSEGAGVPELDVAQLTALFSKKIEDQV